VPRVRSQCLPNPVRGRDGRDRRAQPSRAPVPGEEPLSWLLVHPDFAVGSWGGFSRLQCRCPAFLSHRRAWRCFRIPARDTAVLPRVPTGARVCICSNVPVRKGSGGSGVLCRSRGDAPGEHLPWDPAGASHEQTAPFSRPALVLSWLFSWPVWGRVPLPARPLLGFTAISHPLCSTSSKNPRDPPASRGSDQTPAWERDAGPGAGARSRSGGSPWIRQRWQAAAALLKGFFRAQRHYCWAEVAGAREEERKYLY